MPISVDTDRLVNELPGMLGQAIRSGVRKGEIRRDPTLRHYGVKVDAQDEGQGGHHWLIAGGDVVLYASTDVPAAESHVWNPIFERLLTSLEITREDELAIRQLTNEVLVHLQERHPEEDFQLDEKGIRGDNRVVYLSNLHRDIRAAPGPSVRNHPALRAEPGRSHGPVDRAWDLVRGARPTAPHLEAPELRRVPRPWARAFSSTNGSTTW